MTPGDVKDVESVLTDVNIVLVLLKACDVVSAVILQLFNNHLVSGFLSMLLFTNC